MEKEESSNFQLFRDCLATILIQKSKEDNQTIKRSRNSRKNGKKIPTTSQVPEPKSSSDLEELAEFIDVSSEVI